MNTIEIRFLKRIMYWFIYTFGKVEEASLKDLMLKKAFLIKVTCKPFNFSCSCKEPLDELQRKKDVIYFQIKEVYV